MKINIYPITVGLMTAGLNVTLWAENTKKEVPSASPATQYTAKTITQKMEITGRNFYDYLRRLGISEQEVLDSKGKKWLSVGEGKSDFTKRAAERGVDSQALDAVIVNPHAPDRSKIGLAQSLPYSDQFFDRVISVWLMDYFFDPKTFNDPESGKKALLEMIRVVKTGGDIRISPVQQGELLRLLENLEKQGKIKLEKLPYYAGHFKTENKKRIYVLEPLANSPVTSVKLTRLQ